MLRVQFGKNLASVIMRKLAILEVMSNWEGMRNVLLREGDEFLGSREEFVGEVGKKFVDEVMGVVMWGVSELDEGVSEYEVYNGVRVGFGEIVDRYYSDYNLPLSGSDWVGVGDKDLGLLVSLLSRLGVVVSELQVILNEIGDSYMEESGVGMVSTEVL